MRQICSGLVKGKIQGLNYRHMALILYSMYRFMITFFTSIVASMSTAFYCSQTKKLRIPTTLAYLSFLIFNGTC